MNTQPGFSHANGISLAGMATHMITDFSSRRRVELTVYLLAREGTLAGMTALMNSKVAFRRGRESTVLLFAYK